jgi:hypothetical protein
MNDIAQFLEKNWKAFISAPIPFLILLFLGTFIGFTISKNLNQSEISGLRAKIELYEARLNVETPDEAVRMIDKLKRDFAVLEAKNESLSSIIKEQSDNVQIITSCSWVRPICMSNKDVITRDSVIQLIVHNQMYDEINGKKSAGYYCKGMRATIKQ